MNKDSKTPQSKKVYTPQEMEAMVFSIEEPKSRLRSFKSSPFKRTSLFDNY